MIVRCPGPRLGLTARLPHELPLLRLPSGTVIHRVHDRNTPCDEFLPSDGDASDLDCGGRFDPLPQAAPVCVLYAASSADAALGETLVHVDSRGALRPAPPAEARERALSRLRIARALDLVAFCGLDLHRFPIHNRELTESGKRDYPNTRAWALEFRRRARRAQGIAWISRQDNRSMSFVFWADRMRGSDLVPVGRAVPLDSRAGAALVRTVLRRMGVVTAPPRAPGRRS